MIVVGEDLLRKVAPVQPASKRASQDSVIRALGPVLSETLSRFEINTVPRIAHFLAQICYESDGFCTTVEYGVDDGYNWRADLGNNEPGDGPRFRGRGLIQITGRANYGFYAELLNLDLLNNPDWAADPVNALTIACTFWQRHKLNEAADQDDLILITRRINGGLNGLTDRKSLLAKATAALTESSADAGTATSNPV